MRQRKANMPDLRKMNRHSDSRDSNLGEIVIRDEPVIVICFTSDVDEIALHYEKDPTVKGWIVCIGESCPYCALGAKASKFFLLPVYNREADAVEILRMAEQTGPGTLFSALQAHLATDDSTEHVLVITRDGNRYQTRRVALAKNAERGSTAIAHFKMRVDGGLKLASAFKSMNKAEIEAIPRVRAKLEALGLIEEIDPKPNPQTGEDEIF